MSSHHFVKEGQEPALFIVDALSLLQVQPLLEWAPMVMVLDTALDTVLTWGIKIDAVLAQSDHIDSIIQKTLDQSPVEIFTYKSNDNVIFCGLEALSEQQKAVHVIMEDALGKLFNTQPFTSKMNIVLIDHETRWVFIASGKFEKWLPAGSMLTLHHSPSQKFHVDGLTSFNDKDFITITDGLVKAESTSSFWVGEKL